MAIEQIRPVGNPIYYLEEPSVTPPIWRGEAAKILGLYGKPVEPQVYLNLYDGYTTNEQGERDKKLPKYMHPERRGAYEITANNPKDPSIYSEVAGDRRIDEVYFRARLAVEKEVERQACVRVTKKSEVEESKRKMPKGWRRPQRQPKNLAMFWVDHAGSRLDDCHRHGHLIIMNLSLDRKEGTWKALEVGHLDQQRIADVHRDTMTKGLNELGYKTRRKGNEYEIIGTPAEVKAMFSRRNAGITKLGEDMEAKIDKPMSSKAKGKLSVYDRPEKPPVVSLPERRQNWRQRLGEYEKAVLGVVVKAKHAVKSAQWRQDAKEHLVKLRAMAAVPETKGLTRGQRR